MKCVLLVDDEDSVRKVACAILRRTGGYNVVSQVNGADALAYYASHSQEIDLVITDCVMPGMSGIELAQKLRAMNPAVKVLCMSGYPKGTLDEKVEFLAKPLTPVLLLSKVGEVLGAA